MARPNCDCELCITPGCFGERIIRGLCRCCYNFARRMIADGECTLNQLERKGLILPARPKSPFRAAMQKARLGRR